MLKRTHALRVIELDPKLALALGEIAGKFTHAILAEKAVLQQRMEQIDMLTTALAKYGAVPTTPKARPYQLKNLRKAWKARSEQAAAARKEKAKKAKARGARRA